MALSDTITDLLTRIRNAVSARHRFVDLPYTRMNISIVRVLEAQGYIINVLLNEEQKKMRIFLKYGEGREPVIQNLKRISSPGIRRYVSATKIPKIYGGMGTVILSTSAFGVTDGETARKQNVGGELLCYVW